MNACSSSFGQGSFHESQKRKTNIDSGSRVTWSGSGGIEQGTRVKEHDDDHIHTLQPGLFAVYSLGKKDGSQLKNRTFQEPLEA